jgi:hypothetical protein
MNSIQLQFRLGFAMRYDGDSDVHVSYCPTLSLYSQGETKVEARAAIISAAKMFIVRCYERDILHTALRERGMTKATSEQVAKLATDAECKKEFISVHSEFTDFFEEDVPIHILAAQEAATTCLQ